MSDTARTVERALGLLAEVSAGAGITLSGAARSTGLAPSTALRLLRTLEANGFIEKHAGSYYPGARLVQLGAVALGRQSLVRLVRPSLDRLVERTGESAYFVIRGGRDTAVYLAMVEGTHPIRHTSWVGRAIDIEDLAVAKALDGAVPPSGYVWQRDRDAPDVTAIAAPIRWPGGVAGALNLLGPTYRIDEDTLAAYGEAVATEARDLTRQLGGTVAHAISTDAGIKEAI